MGENLIKTRLVSIRYAAKDINLYEFVPLNGESLPKAEAGAHIGVHLPNGLVRHYSLIKAEENPKSYVIGVKRDKKSTGGSVYIHDKLKVGEILMIEPPKNTFPLDQSAEESIFFAGGIGITPIFSMVNVLQAQGKKWKLFYACRTKDEAAFYDELKDFPQVSFHFDDEKGSVFDIASAVKNVSEKAHLYCCGPLPMMEAFEACTRDFPSEQIHVEYFKPKEIKGGFIVELARSGKVFKIEEGQSILSVLLHSGIDVPYSCMAGICGTCETIVLEGIPDHKDEVLSEAEKASNKKMMICCSGAKTEKLVLDI
ncbi:MAG: oxidoreductase [Acidobacteria bacterium]|jgi:ferredoxin-NADP reductase|nr:MAG: oxidoreductase [Acidobacteriota bacterium]GIU82750.1 MAG: oxidoreductase [Pyrinomonadaceae bacterium]